MNFKFKFILSIFVAVTSFSCSGSAEPSINAQKKNTPNWVNKVPTSNQYWYGIGISNKLENYNYRELAVQNASNEIATQIKVNISSKINSQQNELNDIVTEYFYKEIYSRVEQDLPGIELMESFDDGTYYYTLSRLSIKKYNDFIEDQRKNAVNIAIENIKSSEKFSYQSPQLLIDAFTQISPYMEVPIQVNYPNENDLKQNLFSLITYKMNDYLNRFELNLLQGEIDATIRDNKVIKFGVKCTDNLTGKPIQNIPLIAKMDGNILNTSAVTNKNGIAEFFIQKLTKKKSVQRITIEIDERNIMNQKILPSHNIQTQLTQIINVKGPTIFCDIKEKNLGEDLDIPCIENTLKEQFVKFYGAKFTTNENLAHLVVKGQFNTQSKGEPYKYSESSPAIYNAYIELKFNIIENDNQKELYSKTMNEKGVSYVSFEDAGKSGCEKMSLKISKGTFEEIIKALE